MNGPLNRRLACDVARASACSIGFSRCPEAGIAGEPDAPLFQTAAGKTGTLTGKAMWQQDAYRMIQRRTRDTGIKTRIGNHTFRATGITAYLKNNGTLEAAQHIANHENPPDDEPLRPEAGRDFAR